VFRRTGAGDPLMEFLRTCAVLIYGAGSSLFRRLFLIIHDKVGSILFFLNRIFAWLLLYIILYYIILYYIILYYIILYYIILYYIMIKLFTGRTSRLIFCHIFHQSLICTRNFSQDLWRHNMLLSKSDWLSLLM